ncbi:exonuclease domain-containing protein [Chlamydiota bacterium]
MYLIFLDTETTGLNPEKHRIVEIAYKVVDSVSRHIVVGYEATIAQPLEVWAAADPESLKITGFTWEQTLHGKTEQMVASEIANDLHRLELGQKEGVFICQNPSFDRAFFLQLINADVQEHLGWPYHWLDLASMYWAVCLTSNGPQLTKESDLSKNSIAAHYGIPAEGHPHRAMNGVKHLITCYEAIFGKFAEVANSPS